MVVATCVTGRSSTVRRRASTPRPASSHCAPPRRPATVPSSPARWRARSIRCSTRGRTALAFPTTGCPGSRARSSMRRTRSARCCSPIRRCRSTYACRRSTRWCPATPTSAASRSRSCGMSSPTPPTRHWTCQLPAVCRTSSAPTVQRARRPATATRSAGTSGATVCSSPPTGSTPRRSSGARSPSSHSAKTT